MAQNSKSWLDYLYRSFAPEIYKDDQTRLAVLAILLSLVKGTTVDRLRGDIHTLLVGDPSLGKTKLLEFLDKQIGLGKYLRKGTDLRVASR